MCYCPNDVLDPAAVEAKYPPLNERLLRSWRQRGVGPRFVREGYSRQIMYLISDIETWLAENKQESLTESAPAMEPHQALKSLIARRLPCMSVVQRDELLNVLQGGDRR